MDARQICGAALSPVQHACTLRGSLRRSQGGVTWAFNMASSDFFTLASSLVSSSYVSQAQQARRARESLFKSLLAQRRLPDAGWDDGTVRLLLQELSHAIVIKLQSVGGGGRRG